MNRSIHILVVSLVLACSALAGTRILKFIYQPLTTLGTEGDAAVVVARIPILINAVPEGIIASIAAPNKLLQSPNANIPDSNVLSLLRIGLSADYVSGRHYRVTLDLREMGSTEPYGVTADDVIAGAIKCLRATFDEDQNLGSYELHIQFNKDDKANWSRYEERYESKRKP
uniref:hypothetical protein n=1 Tax=Prosthecobacter sp. TaxID=1965333 RepID=UPI003784E733